MTRKSKPKKSRRTLFIQISAVLSLLTILINVGLKYYDNFKAPNTDTQGQETYLYIQRGADIKEVVASLEKLSVVKDMESFEWLAEKKKYEGKNIVAGKYLIADGLTNNILINHLRAGNGRLDVSITFNQLRDIEGLAGTLTKEISLDSATVYKWLANSDSISKFGFDSNTITSMFIPNTYYVNWDLTVSELMNRMYREYEKFWNPERLAYLEKIGLTKTEVITMASIVYWETKMPEDKRRIAGVYMNRMRIGMPLQADPTLIFAMGDYSIRRVLLVHKEIESPYNTYKYLGLPPGPIIIPPMSYVDAVLDYEEHKYLYFVAKEDFSGYSYFAKSYAQHLVYAGRYQKRLNERKIYK